MGQDSVNIEAALGNADNGVLRLGVLGTDLELVDGHYEYVFQISHPWGCSWKVQHRFRDLLSLHEELETQLDSVPSFPPKHSLSQHLFTSEKQIATKRIVELQRYLQLMVANRDTGQLPAVQKALGATQPKAPGIVRVANWEHNRGSACASMELEFDLEEDAVQAPCCTSPIESVEVQVRVMPKLGPLGGGSEAAEKTYTRSFRAPVRIADLPIGREIEFKVRLCNIVGGSPPVAMRIMVPGPGDAADSPTAIIPSSPMDTGIAPPLPSEQIGEGCRVSALWAGNGHYYDAVVRRGPSDGKATVDWLRPAPLSGEELHCVLDDGGDDTEHRRVPVHQLRRKQSGVLASSKAAEPPKTPLQPLRTLEPTPEAPSFPRFEVSRERTLESSHDSDFLEAAEVPLDAPQRKPRVGSNFSELFDAERKADPLETQPRQPGSSKLADLFDREDEEMPAETTSPFAKPRAFFASTASNVNRSNLAEKLRGPPASTASNVDKRTLAELFDAENEELPPRNPKASSKVSPRASGLFLESADANDDTFDPRPRQPQKAASKASAIFAAEEDEDAMFDAKPKKTSLAKRASVFSNDDDNDNEKEQFNPSPRSSKTASNSKSSMFEEEDDEPFNPSPRPLKTASGSKPSIFEEEDDEPFVPAASRLKTPSAAKASIFEEEDDQGGSNQLPLAQSMLPGSKASMFEEEDDEGKSNQLPPAQTVKVDERVAAKDEAATTLSELDEEVATGDQAVTALSADLAECEVSASAVPSVEVSVSRLLEEHAAGEHASDTGQQGVAASNEAAELPAASMDDAANAEVPVDAVVAVDIPLDLSATSEETAAASVEVPVGAVAAVDVPSELPAATEEAAAASVGVPVDAVATVDIPLDLTAAGEEAAAATVEVPVGVVATDDVPVSTFLEELVTHEHSMDTVEYEPSHKLSTASGEAAAAIAASVMDECAAAIKEAATDTAEPDIQVLVEPDFSAEVSESSI